MIDGCVYSCESVKGNDTTLKDELSLICAKFSHCSPGDNHVRNQINKI